MTAHEFLEALKNHKKEVKDFALLQLVCNTAEIGIGGISINEKTFYEAENKALKYEAILLQNCKRFDGIEYETFISSIYLASMFKDWIEEKTESDILENYKIRLGEFNAKKEAADWLLYSLDELSKILKYKDVTKAVDSLRVRMKYGAKEELLDLLRLKNIGKVRARMLFNKGLKTTSDVRKSDINFLSSIIGIKIAEDVKEQLGIKVEQKSRGSLLEY